MRAILLVVSLIPAISGMTALCEDVQAAAQMKEVRAKVERDGKTLEAIDRIFILPGASFNLHTLVGPEGDGRLAPQKQYGDFFFGLNFGRVGNGGWNVWHFFSVTAKNGDKSFGIVDKMDPVQAFACDASGVSIASILWPLPPQSGAPVSPDSSFRLTAVKVPAHPQWLFFRAEIKGAEFETLSLSCYPGGTDSPPERERVVLTREAEYNLAKQKYDFVPQSPGMFLTSRFAQERYACLLVYEQEKVKLVTLPGGGGDIGIRMQIAPGTSTFLFALGYSNEMPAPQQEAAMFLKERQDNIRSSLATVEWNPRTEDPELEIASLMSLFDCRGKLGRPDDPQARAEAEKLACELRKAKGDLGATIAARAKLKAFKEALVKAELEALK